MPCGCAKRREMGHRIVSSLRNRDYEEARQQMREMAQSAAYDIKKVTGIRQNPMANANRK